MKSNRFNIFLSLAGKDPYKFEVEEYNLTKYASKKIENMYKFAGLLSSCDSYHLICNFI